MCIYLHFLYKSAQFHWALENLYGILCLTITNGGKNGKYIRIYIKEQKDFSRARHGKETKATYTIKAKKLLGTTTAETAVRAISSTTITPTLLSWKKRLSATSRNDR